MIKSILEKLASILMYPWRKAYRKRNGICVQENRHEIPNDIFLGLVSEKLAEGHTANWLSQKNFMWVMLCWRKIPQDIMSYIGLWISLATT